MARVEGHQSGLQRGHVRVGESHHLDMGPRADPKVGQSLILWSMMIVSHIAGDFWQVAWSYGRRSCKWPDSLSEGFESRHWKYWGGQKYSYPYLFKCWHPLQVHELLEKFPNGGEACLTVNTCSVKLKARMFFDRHNLLCSWSICRLSWTSSRIRAGMEEYIEFQQIFQTRRFKRSLARKMLQRQRWHTLGTFENVTGFLEIFWFCWFCRLIRFLWFYWFFGNTWLLRFFGLINLVCQVYVNNTTKYLRYYFKLLEYIVVQVLSAERWRKGSRKLKSKRRE